MPKVVAELVYSIAEAFSADIPDVPTPDDINLESLAKALGKSSADELVFDTRPIGKVTESRNGRNYSTESVLSLVEQVKEKRPEGRWGHLSESEASTRYELPAVRWINAVYQESNETAYGKLVALTLDAERHIRSARELNAKIGTSIYAHNPVIENKKVKSYDLVTIDLANAERVGIYDMNSVPKISKEMDNLNSEENKVTEEEKRAAELAAANTNKPVAETADVTQLRRIVESQETEIDVSRPLVSNLKTVAELLGAKVEEVPAKVRALREQVKSLTAENVALLSATIENEVAEAVKVETVQPIVVEQVTALNPTTREEVKSALAKVLEKASIKALIETAVVAESGGNVTTTGASGSTKTPADSIFE